MRTKKIYFTLPLTAVLATASPAQESPLFHKIYAPAPPPVQAPDLSEKKSSYSSSRSAVTTAREALVRPHKTRDIPMAVELPKGERPPKWSRTPKQITLSDGTVIERDNPPPPATAVANSAASGVRWPANDKDFRALSVPQRRVVWKEIKEVRKVRDMPQTRGPWFTIHSREDRVARAASDAQYSIILAQADSMMRQGSQGQDDAARGAGAVMATGAATVLIKKTMRRRRPYPNDHKFGSFPSGHTSTVFAMAAVFASAQPQQRIMALGSAGLVGWSRVKVRAHHWDDVLIGGALGYMIGRQFAPSNPTAKHQNYPVASWRMTF